MTLSYDQFIAPGQYTFRSRNDAVRLGDVVTFHREMAARDGGAVVGVGQEILVLDREGRIRIDYQLIVG